MTKLERSWILYDWANSAYSITVTTAVFPLFFKGVVAEDLAAATSTALLAYANTGYALIVALLAPVLGTLADYPNRRKLLFGGFLVLGLVATALLAVAQEDGWQLTLAI